MCGIDCSQLTTPPFYSPVARFAPHFCGRMLLSLDAREAVAIGIAGAVGDFISGRVGVRVHP